MHGGAGTLVSGTHPLKWFNLGLNTNRMRATELLDATHDRQVCLCLCCKSRQALAPGLAQPTTFVLRDTVYPEGACLIWFAAACMAAALRACRVVHAALSLVLCGREDVVEHANIVNLQTLAPDIDDATRQAAQTSTLIDKLAMTPQQLHTIATGTSVYMHMLKSVVQERQALQSQFAADSQQGPAISSSSASSSRNDLARLQGQQHSSSGTSGWRSSRSRRHGCSC